MYFCTVFLLAAVNAQREINLGYKPTRPFYHPQPAGSHLGVIVAPGKPWPDDEAGYQNFSQTSEIVNRVQEIESSSSGPGGFTWSEEKEVTSVKPGQITDELNLVVTSATLVNRIKDTTIATSKIEDQTPINLAYKPTRPFYHPNPGNTLGQIIPPGQSWPESPEGYQTGELANRIKDSTATTTSSLELKPQPGSTSVQNSSQVDNLPPTSQPSQTSTIISLEYKPNRPFHHSKPGNTLSQIIPPGKPWPDSPEGYQNFSQVGNIPNIKDRIKETTLKPGPTSSQKTPMSLEYQPNRPPFHPNPSNNVGQIIPPGEPWPDSPEGYQNFSQVGNVPNVENRIKETTLKPGPTSSRKTPISLEYQPNRPPFHPNPGNNLGQIIPPGEPWPDSPEGYQNFSQVGNVPNVVDRIKETVLEPKPTSSQKTPVSLEYQPNRPSFHPNPGNNVGQIVPSGEPWPDSPEGYQNFSQIANLPNLETRIETTSQSSIIKSEEKTPISLEYKPSRPSFHPNPGNVVAQIIPSEVNQNFNQTSSSPDLGNRIQESSTTESEPGSTPDLISLLQGLVDKQKPVTSEAEPIGFVWETETTSQKIDPNQETSTVEETLFTSPLLEDNNEENLSDFPGKEDD